MPVALAKLTASSRTAWCYVSGRVSALAGQLLSQRATLDLLSVRTLEELLGRVRQTLLFADLPDAAQPFELAESMQASYAAFARQLAAASPTTAVADIFLLVIEWEAFRAYLRAADLGQPRVATPGSATSEALWAACWQSTRVEPAYEPFAAAAAAVKADAQREEPNERAVDELTCPYETRAIVQAAQRTGSAEIVRWVTTWQRLEVALALLRARFNAWSHERLAPVLASLGAEPQDVLHIWSPEHRDWRSPLLRLGLSAIHGLSEEASLPAAEVERLIDDSITRLSHAGRSVAFGPEPVFAFLWGLRCEALNLRLIVTGLAAGVPAEAIARDIRQTYV